MNIENTIKDEYLAIVVKWIIENSIWNNDGRKFFSKNYTTIFSHFFMINDFLEFKRQFLMLLIQNLSLFNNIQRTYIFAR